MKKLIISLRLLVVLFALLIYVLLIMNIINNIKALLFYSILLITYLSVEIKNLYTYSPRLILLNPVVLASIITFAIPFGVTNILFFMPQEMVSEIDFESIVTVWMIELMQLVLLGAGSMWVGYNSQFGKKAGQLLKGSLFFRKLISSSMRINKFSLFVLFGIGLVGKLITIKLGLYGYSTSVDRINEAAGYSQYLYIARGAGVLALAGASLQCFSTSPHAIFSDRFFLVTMLVYEVVFGLFSGMKSAVVMPFIIVGVVYYSIHNRFPKWIIPVVYLGMLVAYQIIEPYRNAYNANGGDVMTSLDSIVTMMSTAHNESDTNEEDVSTEIKMLARSNLTYIASLGIEYKATNELPKDSPEFLSNIILAPVHAVIPRFLWDDKPLENNGLWYNQQVMGKNDSTSIAMSPFTYLNFAGGFWAVAVGFFIVGLVQRALFDGLRYFGGGGLIILLGMLNGLTNIDNSFNNFIINLVRYFPILVFVQYLLINKNKINKK